MSRVLLSSLLTSGISTVMVFIKIIHIRPFSNIFIPKYLLLISLSYIQRSRWVRRLISLLWMDRFSFLKIQRLVNEFEFSQNVTNNLRVIVGDVVDDVCDNPSHITL